MNIRKPFAARPRARSVLSALDRALGALVLPQVCLAIALAIACFVVAATKFGPAYAYDPDDAMSISALYQSFL